MTISRIRLSVVLPSRFLLGLFFACATVFVADAQQLEPVLDAGNDQLTSNIEIQKIYNLTEVAKSAADFERIAHRCEKLLNESIYENDQEYLNSIIAWSRNRLAQRCAKNSVSMKEVGLESQAEQQLQRAVTQFDLVIKNHSKTWRSWLGRAAIHAQQGEYENALEKFVQVTKLNRKNKQAVFNCAEIDLYLKRYDDAVEYYSHLLANDPSDIQARTGRGHCYMAKEEFAKASEDYRTVIKLKADDEIALCNLGDALQKLEKWDEAYALFESASILPNATIGLERMANFLVTSGIEKMIDPSRAVRLAKRAVEKSNSSAASLMVLAAAYDANEQPNLANQTLERANGVNKPTGVEARNPTVEQRK